MKGVFSLSRYDIYDIEIHPENSVQLAHGTMYAAEGFHYVTVSVEEVLFEGGRSIRWVGREGGREGEREGAP